MRKLLVIVFVVIIIVLAVWYFFIRRPAEPVQFNYEPQPSPQSTWPYPSLPKDDCAQYGRGCEGK